MGWLDGLFKAALPAIGTVFGSPVGGLIGSTVAGGIDAYQSDQAMKKAEAAQNEAKAANESRYRQLIGEYVSNRDRARGLNDQVSRQDLTDIEQQFGALRNSTQANLSARGLGNTTIPISIFQGIQREQAGAVNNANDQRLKRTIQIDSDLTGELARAIERRSDVGPSDQTIQGLAAAAGQAQNAIGGSLKGIIDELLKQQQSGQTRTAPVSQYLNSNAGGYFGGLTTPRGSRLV